jgi:hypothetical protein
MGADAQKGCSMMVLGKYPRLAVLALLVSLAVASGAIKKWS